MNYLILTEDKDRQAIASILDRHFDGYTLYPGIGRWNGTYEPSLTILLANVEPNHVQQVAEEIKAYNNQESVMVITLEGTVNFL